MGEWRYASYKRKGLSHFKDGTNCQDNTCVVETENYIVAALADGLGSLKYSEIASDVATKSICKAFEGINCSKKELSSFLLQYVVDNIQHEAEARGIALKEMDCTFVFVYINKNESEAIIGRLGDSAICVFGENYSIALNDGNKSANGTSAVLDRDAIDNFTINFIDYKKEKIKGFILSSDGLENILYMKGSNSVNKAAEEYFNTLVTSASPEAELRQKIFELVKVPGSPFDDDISIIVIGCNDEPISLPEDATWLCKCGCRNPLYATYCIKCNSDFTILYENVKFKEHGGKAAFFKKINQNPEEEKKWLGIEKKNHLLISESELVCEQKVENGIDMGGAYYKQFDNNNETASHNNKEPKETENKNKQSKKRGNCAFLILLAICSLMLVSSLCIFLNMSQSIQNKIDEIDNLKLEIIRLKNEKEQNEKTKEIDVLVLEDNSCIHLDLDIFYWGELDDQNKPNGIGIMKDGNIYYVGTYDHGKKNGQFMIADSRGIETVEYKNDKVVESKSLEKATQEERTGDLQEKSYMLRSKANLCEKAGSDNELVKELSAETFIIPFKGTEYTVDGKVWIKVKTSDGYCEGWILKSLIDY